MIKTEQLRYLIELDKTKSFHKTAENLYLSQPAISLAIRNLEKELGVILFERTSTGVYPTEIGQEVIQQAKIVLDSINTLYLLCDKHLTPEEVHLESLNISSVSSLWSIAMPHFFPLLHKDFPETTLSIYSHTFDTFYSFIASEPYNVGLNIVWEDEHQSMLEKYHNVRATRLFKVTFHLATSKSANFELPAEIDLTQDTTCLSTIPYVSFAELSVPTNDIQNDLLSRKFIKHVFHAPVSQLFRTYLQQGLAAGIILKLGINLFLSANRKQFESQLNHSPIKTEKECILYFFSNQDLPESIYQKLIQYLHVSLSQL